MKIAPKFNYTITINWLVAGVALAKVWTALADWTCPTTTMFMVTFSAPIFDILGSFLGVK